MGIDLKPYLDPSAANRAAAAEVRAHHGRGGPLWLCAGRMVYYKGFTHAVRHVTASRRSARADRRRPRRAAFEGRGRASRSGDRVDFLGKLPHYLDVLPYYLAADAFWFPSNARSEAFGLVQVEAMACGCPVLNTAIPHSGVPWVSRHEETGLTVPINDPAALAAAAPVVGRTRIANTPGQRRAPAPAEEFDHRVMAERSLDIYRQVLADPGLTGPAGRPVMVPSLP